MQIRKILWVMALCVPLLARADELIPLETEWRFAVGFGGIQAPTYLGDDETETRLLPDLRVRKGERFEASVNRGMRYALLLDGRWRAGPTLTYDFGREEDSGDDNELEGLGDVDASFELGFMLEHDGPLINSSLEIRQGLSGGHEGLTGKLSFLFSDRLTGFGPPIIYTIGPRLQFGDREYLSSFFDVNADQAAASGISEYSADGGLYSLGIQATAVIPVSRQVSLFSFIGAGRLLNDVAESSIVEERGGRDQAAIGVFLNYGRF